VSSPSRQEHGLDLLDVLPISLPTPRAQEAQLDQVVEAHWIAREDRVDNASGKEEDDQDQFSSCIPTYLGLIRYMTLQPAEPKHFFSRTLIAIPKSDFLALTRLSSAPQVGSVGHDGAKHHSPCKPPRIVAGSLSTISGAPR
jgi:hypothetical protein